MQNVNIRVQCITGAPQQLLVMQRARTDMAMTLATTSKQLNPQIWCATGDVARITQSMLENSLQGS